MRMKAVGKFIGILGVGAAVAGAAYVWRTLRARGAGGDAAAHEVATQNAQHELDAAGVMFVGAVEEVELGPADILEVIDPAEILSEHAEINELRSKMP